MYSSANAAACKRWYEKKVASDPNYQRRKNLRSKFGITPEQYNDLLAKQGGICAICGTDEPGGRGGFHVDHDRSCCPGNRACGKCLRGLLCSRCNPGIAMFQDNPERLSAAIHYLDYHTRRLNEAAADYS